MKYAPQLVFAAALVATAALVLGTTPALPERIATHFNGAGVPDAWMTRDGYRAYIFAFAIGFPLLVAGTVGVLPRRFPRAINMPNRAYWLAPERQGETLATLFARACWLGVLMTAMIAGVHCLLLQANAASPPRLPALPFVALIAAFLVLLVVWIVALRRRFRLPA